MFTGSLGSASGISADRRTRQMAVSNISLAGNWAMTVLVRLLRGFALFPLCLSHFLDLHCTTHFMLMRGIASPLSFLLPFSDGSNPVICNTFVRRTHIWVCGYVYICVCACVLEDIAREEEGQSHRTIVGTNIYIEIRRFDFSPGVMEHRVKSMKRTETGNVFIESELSKIKLSYKTVRSRDTWTKRNIWKLLKLCKSNQIKIYYMIIRAKNKVNKCQAGTRRGFHWEAVQLCC